MSDLKEKLSLQHDQCNKEIWEQRNPENKSQSSTSDNKEGTMKTNHNLTYQKSKCPILDDKEGTTMIESTQQDTRTLPWSKDAPASDDATRGRNPHHIHKLIKHSDMTWLWMTQPQDNAYQPKWEGAMIPLLQTSAHYPETSKQINQSSNNGSFRTLSASPIQEHANSTKVSLSTMTHGTVGNSLLYG